MLNLARFDTNFVGVRKMLLSVLTMAGKFGKFGLKALFVSCAFVVRVAETLDNESTNEKISVDVAVTINQRSLVFIEEINK